MANQALDQSGKISFLEIRCLSLKRLLLALYVALAGSYGLSVTLFLALRLLVGEQWTIIAIFNTFLHLLLLPALALLPISLLLRRSWLARIQVPAVITFLLAYGSLFLPRTPPTSLDGERLKILTYNLHGGADTAELVAAVIRETDTDLVALQELSLDAAAYLTEALAEHYPYRALHPQEESTRGMGVFSRYPITADEYWRNPDIARSSLGHQRIELKVNGITVAVYNAHPIHPGMADRLFDVKPRGLEIDRVLKRAARDPGPVLIAGDFNLPDQSEDYQRITARYTDSYREIGWGMGWTFPDWSHPAAVAEYVPVALPLRPVLRLDYVFHSNHFQAVEARVWPESGGSDHRPLYVTLAMERRK